MYKNYESRVKEFITEMIKPSKRIKITDLSEKVDSTREEIIKENSLKKPFIFKGYTSELDRIIHTEKTNKLLYNLPDYPEKKSTSKKEIPPPPPKINIHIEIPNNKTIEAVNSNKNNNSNLKEQNNNIFLLSNSLDAAKTRSFRRLSISEKKQIHDLIKKDAILQPQMRFRARTDLERVYDALNGKYIKNSEREIIERQLKNINLYDYIKPKELLKGKKTNKKDEEKEKKEMQNKKENKNYFQEPKRKNIYGPSNVYYEAKNNDKKPWARKDNLNTEARRFLSLYHIKTHFKATEEIAEYHEKDIKKLNESCFLLPHLFTKKHKQKTLQNLFSGIDNSECKLLKNKSNATEMLDYSDIDSGRLFKFGEDHENDEMKDDDNNNNYDINALKNNPLIKDKEKYDPKKIEFLAKFAFSENEVKKENSDNVVNKNKTDEDDDNSNSSNTKLNKKMNSMAKKILRKCNVTSIKSKYNDTVLKSNAGKNMITKGLSVEEFINKYKLKY